MRNSRLTQYRSWRLWPVHLVAKANERTARELFFEDLE